LELQDEFVSSVGLVPLLLLQIREGQIPLAAVAGRIQAAAGTEKLHRSSSFAPTICDRLTRVVMTAPLLFGALEQQPSTALIFWHLIGMRGRAERGPRTGQFCSVRRRAITKNLGFGSTGEDFVR
jgi:hypothetical protein